MDREARITDLLRRRYYDAAEAHQLAAREMVEFVKELDSLGGHTALAYLRPPPQKKEKMRRLTEAVHSTHDRMMDAHQQLEDWERYQIPPLDVGHEF